MHAARERWERVAALFETALAQPADRREAWLREATDGDVALYHEVRTLLDHDEIAASLLGENITQFAKAREEGTARRVRRGG